MASTLGHLSLCMFSLLLSCEPRTASRKTDWIFEFTGVVVEEPIPDAVNIFIQLWGAGGCGSGNGPGRDLPVRMRWERLYIRHDLCIRWIVPLYCRGIGRVQKDGVRCGTAGGAGGAGPTPRTSRVQAAGVGARSPCWIQGNQAARSPLPSGCSRTS